MKPQPYEIGSQQGTFVYNPDISVYIETDIAGTIDVSKDIVDFSLTRNIGGMSTFNCALNNKYSKYDRVIARMSKLVVFLKRISWLQVFAGYVTTAPYETVVPGSVEIQAVCTLKRLAHTFWDPGSTEARQLFPAFIGNAQFTADGGSAASMFKLLTAVAHWQPDQIHIQKIPEKWVIQAAALAQEAKADLDPVIIQALQKLLDADGWTGYLQDQGLGSAFSSSTGDTTGTQSGKPPSSTKVDAQWQQKWGRKSPPDGRVFPNSSKDQTPHLFNGKISSDAMTRIGVVGTQFNPGFLRPDAAYAYLALKDAMLKAKKTAMDLYVVNAYMDYEQQIECIKSSRGPQQQAFNDCTQGRCPCPAGTSPLGWGTAFVLNRKGVNIGRDLTDEYTWLLKVAPKYGFESRPLGTSSGSYDLFTFKGSANYPGNLNMKPGTTPTTDPNAAGQGSSSSTGKGNVNQAGGPFNAMYFYPGIDVESDVWTGDRAWLNDSPLLQTITDLCGACMRSFQSAPNGDFIAWFPDKSGIYGKTPAIRIRDIEVINFNLSISDDFLTTHVAVAGNPLNAEPSTGINLNWAFDAGFVSVQQDKVMQLLLGLDPTKKYTDLGGNWILQKFGLRPFRQEANFVRDPAWVYMLALHMFQEKWTQQFITNDLQLSFLPEIYPGMRIELVDHGLAVYVEQVVHSGSRQEGFTTQLTVSMPMKRGPHGEWVLLPLERKPIPLPDDPSQQVSDVQTGKGKGKHHPGGHNHTAK